MSETVLSTARKLCLKACTTRALHSYAVSTQLSQKRGSAQPPTPPECLAFLAGGRAPRTSPATLCQERGPIPREGRGQGGVEPAEDKGTGIGAGYRSFPPAGQASPRRGLGQFSWPPGARDTGVPPESAK
jgi:hypothetical protein